MAYTNSPLVSYTRLSPNNSGARNHTIDRITPHCVVGQCSVETLGDIFADPAKQASSNYGIGPDGRVGMYVEEKNKSWCSGGELNVNGRTGSQNDARAVTIECASDMTAPFAFNNVVYNRLIQLCADICKRNGKNKLVWFKDAAKAERYSDTMPKNEMLLTVHRWYAMKSCPGDWLMQRMDDLAAKVTAILNGGDTPEPGPTPAPEGETCTVTGKIPILRYDPMNKSPWVEIAQGKLIAAGYDIKYGADGYFGGATQAALEDYQEKNGLPVTSVFDGPTWAEILN